MLTGSGGGAAGFVAEDSGVEVQETARAAAMRVVPVTSRMATRIFLEPLIYSPSSKISTMADVVLGEFEQLVLLALVRQAATVWRLESPRISATAGRDVSLGASTRPFDRLEAKG